MWSEQEKIWLEREYWSKLFFRISKVVYVFDHCQAQSSKSYFFIFVFDNLSLEVLNTLVIISQRYSCITLKRAEKSDENIDLEYAFQVNHIANPIKLNCSTLCFLVATNPRYEGYYLNIKLRQRFLKGNFKCLSLGSLIDLTFPISFLGSNLGIIKTVTEGNNLVCQDLKFASNPIVIYNSEFFKRNDSRNACEIFKMLFYYNIFDKVWNGLNKLSSAFSDTGVLILKQVPKLNLKDLNNFSSLYLLNITTISLPNLKKIIEFKLLKKRSWNSSKFLSYKLLVDQNRKKNSNKTALNVILKNYVYVHNSTFYENEETFVNAEGFIKRTTKLIQRKQTKNCWQILRKFLHYCNVNLSILTLKDNQLFFFHSKNFYSFKNFLAIQYYAVQNLTKSSFYLTVANKAMILNLFNFKPKTKKVLNTKIKH